MSVVLITGASSGIGLAAARIMSAAGDQVVGISRSGREETLQADLSTEQGCQQAIDLARERGPIRALVLSAGIGSSLEKSIGEQPTEIWRETMALNLDAPFYLIRMAWPDLKAAGDGRIVLISSTAATMGAPAFSAYSASKAGLLGMMRSVAQDGAPHGITCNSLLPGWVRSEMTDLSAAHDAEQLGISVAEVWKQREASYAAGRTIEPDEVGNAIAFFCSKQSSGISGEEIRVALGGAW